jgi:iron complex transport system permease protein
MLVGPHQGWIMAYSVLIAPIVLGLADSLGRVLTTGEVPVGVVTAFVGAPVLIYMVRRFRVAEA